MWKVWTLVLWRWYQRLTVEFSPVLESRHIARRARQCNPSESQGDYVSTISDESNEAAWRTRQLALLRNMHLPLSISDVDFDVRSSKKAVRTRAAPRPVFYLTLSLISIHIVSGSGGAHSV